MSGLAQASCQLTRVRNANSRSAKGWPGNRTKYSYDANGNAITRQGSTISWSSYNYPITINAGSGGTAETVAFSYGPDRQRWQQMYTGNSTQETTNYIGGLLEVVASGGVTDYRHYINVAGEQVAVYSRKSSGTNTFSYLLSDHQASVASITSSSGAQVVGESFTAFGSRRNPTTWSGAPSNSDLTTIAGITREGYTFQTALGLWMGMNHMNGRVEDSITGRFLSADATIPDAAYSQSYNRYTYVNNNPLTNSDPSGFSPCGHNCRPVIGMCATSWIQCDEPIAQYLPGASNPGAGSVQGISGTDANYSGASTADDIGAAAEELDAAVVSAINDNLFVAPLTIDTEMDPSMAGNVVEQGSTDQGLPGSASASGVQQVAYLPAGQNSSATATLNANPPLYNGSAPQNTSAQLSVSLAPGSNNLSIEIVNSSTGLQAQYNYLAGQNVIVGATLDVTTPAGSFHASGAPISQSIAPGSFTLNPLPGSYVGPGTAVLSVQNYSVYTVTVTLSAFAQQTAPRIGL